MLLQISTPETIVNAVETTAQQISTQAAPQALSIGIEQTQESIKIFDLALKGGWIMIPLVLLFLITVYIFVERYIAISKATKEPQNFMNTLRDFIHNGRLDSAKALCQTTHSPIARMLEKGIIRIGKPLNDINAAIENVGKSEISKLEKNMAWLSTSAGAAPMIGFLGTVVGMVRVFFDMASKGNNIDVGTLANGMYQAMVTTVAGLIVGIIAYICYNILVSRVEKMVYLLETKATEFMDLLNEPLN